jgi:hypothetical protein
MRDESRVHSEAIVLRHVLAGLALETKLIRLQRELQAKNWETQPRAPAGQPNGGEWVPAPIGAQWASLQEDRPNGPSPQDPPPLTESATLEDGTRVLSIRIRAGRRPFDEQHTVTAPDGESVSSRPPGKRRRFATAKQARSYRRPPLSRPVSSLSRSFNRLSPPPYR